MSVRSFQQIADEADAVLDLGYRDAVYIGTNTWDLTTGATYRVIQHPGMLDCYSLHDDEGDSRMRSKSEFRVIPPTN